MSAAKLDAQLRRALAQRFADHVLATAQLPEARRGDVESAPHFTAFDGELRCTCDITGSTYTAEWDGTESEAMRLADEAADGTAHLVTRTPYYAWLRSRKPTGDD